MDKVCGDMIEMDIADAVMERPRGFIAGGRRFSLYPVTLGVSYLVTRVISGLGLDGNLLAQAPFVEILRVASAHKEEAARVIALRTARGRDEATDEAFIGERVEYFLSKLSVEDIAKLLMVALTKDDVAAWQKHLGIEREREWMHRAMKAKDGKGGSVSFFGKSVFGALIVPACEKLRMKPREVVWDVSLAMLKMLLADATVTVYLSDKERKKARIPSDRTRIKADDPAQMETIKNMNWD